MRVMDERRAHRSAEHVMTATERPLRIVLDMVGNTGACWGGMQQQVYTLGRHLAARGHEPLLILRTDPSLAGDMRSYADAAGICCVEDPRLAAVDFHSPPLRRWMSGLRDVLRRERVDIYHMHTALMGNEVWSAALARAAGYAPILTYHTLVRPESRQRELALRAMHRWLSVRTIGVSRAVCESVRRKHQPHASRVACVPNGIDEPRFAPALPRQDGQLVIGVLGRLSPEKGVDAFVAAMGKLDRTLPVRAVIMGEGAQLPELECQAQALGVSGRIEFRGLVPDASRLLTAFDLIVIPSRSEAFSLVAAEAFAAGRPVIATRVGGLCELVRDGETGWLVPVDDPAAMARAIEAAAGDPERRARMGAAARRHYEAELRAETMLERTLHVYASALSAQRCPYFI